MSVAWGREYSRIRRRLLPLGLRFDRDIEARDVLVGLVSEDNSRLLERIRGKAAIVFASGKSLKQELMQFADAGARSGGVWIAADKATESMLGLGLLPDIIATDLDGDVASILIANRLGSVVVVHAHGDNIPALRRHVPLLKNPVCTTQARGKGVVHNFGGFTDGDRCVFLARAFGASRIGLVGFDFSTRIDKFAVGNALVKKLARDGGIFSLGEKAAKNGIPRMKLSQFLLQGGKAGMGGKDGLPLLIE